MFARLFWIAALTATMAFAQRGGGGGGMGGDTQGMGGGAPRVVRLTKAEMFANQLKLNDEQREQAQQILNDALREAAPLRTLIDQVRTEIVAAMINGDGPDAVKKATDRLVEAEARLTGVQVKAFAQICALLKPNQQSRAAAAFDLLAAVLDPPGGTARGGGRRGRE
jgi:Spy/CpxP family protein refolding chaperone